MVLIRRKYKIRVLFLLLSFFSVIASESELDKKILEQKLGYEKLLEKDEIDEEDQILLFNKLSFFLERIKSSKTFSEKESLLIKSIINKSEDFELDEYDFDEIAEEITLLIDRINKSNFKIQFYGVLRFVTWNYRLELIDLSGVREPLYSKEKGICTGLGLTYGNSYWGLSTDLCLAYMDATVGEDSKTIKYNQSNVPVDAFISTSSIFWKPKDQVSLGIGPLLVYHKGSYSAPNGGHIEDSNKFSYGYHVFSNWQKDKINFIISIGDIKKYKSSVWLLGVGYIF